MSYENKRHSFTRSKFGENTVMPTNSFGHTTNLIDTPNILPQEAVEFSFDLNSGVRNATVDIFQTSALQMYMGKIGMEIVPSQIEESDAQDVAVYSAPEEACPEDLNEFDRLLREMNLEENTKNNSEFFDEIIEEIPKTRLKIFRPTDAPPVMDSIAVRNSADKNCIGARCSQTIPSTAKFCKFCGAAQVGKFCMECGCLLNPNHRDCPECGTRR